MRSAIKLVGATAISVFILLLTSLLPSSAKATLVFWRLRHALPGHRAFSRHARDDPRINMDELQRNIGPIPSGPRDQNALWYKLFKKVEPDPAVAHANKYWLLFRDLAALSIMLAFLAAGVLLALGGDIAIALAASALLIAQYFGAAIAARNEAIALVRNVLALYSIKKR